MVRFPHVRHLLTSWLVAMARTRRWSGLCCVDESGHALALLPRLQRGEGVGAGAGAGSCLGREMERKSCAMIDLATEWALNSAVECHLHTVEVVGSNPTAPTIDFPLPNSHLRVAVVLP